MAYDPYQNPWVGGLKPPRTAPDATSQALVEYLRRHGTPSRALADLSPPAEEKSVIDKITDATRRVRTQIADGKLNKSL